MSPDGQVLSLNMLAEHHLSTSPHTSDMAAYRVSHHCKYRQVAAPCRTLEGR